MSPSAKSTTREYITSVHRLTVTISYGKRRRLKITLDDDGRVCAFAPKYMTLKEIDRFVEANYDWIVKHRAKLEEKTTLPFIDPSEQRRRARIIKARTSAFLAVYDGKKPVRITVRNMTTRWGSCSANGNISLNVHLLDVEPELFEYVLIHELSHLYHMNHSPLFWAQVAKYCPDYKKCRARLKDYRIPRK
ncbi:MAG: M48 family metallopeptidase [Clostridiales bacterium]|nr:M48 family metallopeptidase [Clostridiales bacterium]MBP5417637.1 M48 family metallopeptidase [Clostridiales bacterium]